MAQNCQGCGSELFPGQRFCRVCGRKTGDLIGQGDAPTQMMSPVGAEQPTQMMSPPPSVDSYTGPVHAQTGPAARPQTSPVYPQQPNYYQQAPPVPAQMYLPPKKGSKIGWVFTFIGIGVFATIILAILFVARASRNFPRNLGHHTSTASSQPMSGEQPFSGTSTVADDDTVLSKTYPFVSTTSLVVHASSDDVDIETWDQPNAQVRIVKSGGSARNRDDVHIFEVANPDQLAFRTSSRRRRGVEVKYEIKLPKTARSVSIDSASGTISVRGVTAPINVESESGDVTINGVTGAVKARSDSGNITLSSINGSASASNESGNVTLNSISGSASASNKSGNISLNDINGLASATNVEGDVSATFDSLAPPPNQTLDFESVNGNVELLFKKPANFSLDANTVSGDIALEPSYGININRPVVGAHASGVVGAGGPMLKANTVSGNISITQAH